MSLSIFKASVPVFARQLANLSAVLKLRGQETRFTGRYYLLNFALPNFFFHSVTAYGILRHNGMEIGKQDFLGSF